MFEAWCLVEILGHVQLAGKVTEEVVFGAPMMRVDVPETSCLPGFTKLYGAGSIYSITPVPEEVARAMAERLAERPWNPAQVGIALPAPANGEAAADADDWPDDDLDEDDWPDDDDDEDEDEDLPDFDDDKRAAARWAYELVNDPAGFVVLDTETTGLGDDAEACQIAVIDQAGTVLLDTLVRPTVPIPADATRIHGISNAMVADAPAFGDVLPKLQDALRGRRLAIYNKAYDLPILQGMVYRLPGNLALTDALPYADPVSCVMLRYAAFAGDWNDYRGDYRWQKLTNACAQQGVEVVDAPAHSALGDCLRTLGVIKAMAAWHEQQLEVPADPTEISF